MENLPREKDLAGSCAAMPRRITLRPGTRQRWFRPCGCPGPRHPKWCNAPELFDSRQNTLQPARPCRLCHTVWACRPPLRTARARRCGVPRSSG